MKLIDENLRYEKKSAWIYSVSQIKNEFINEL